MSRFDLFFILVDDCNEVGNFTSWKHMDPLTGKGTQIDVETSVTPF